MKKQGIIISPEEYEKIKSQLKELSDIRENAISVNVSMFGTKWIFFTIKDELREFVAEQANNFQKKITDAESLKMEMEINGYVSLDNLAKNNDTLSNIKSKLERIKYVPWWKSNSDAIDEVLYEIESRIIENNSNMGRR